MQEVIKISRRGGHRDGAGRKAKPDAEKRVQMSLTFSPEVAALLMSMPNRSKFISELVLKHFSHSAN